MSRSRIDWFNGIFYVTPKFRIFPFKIMLSTDLRGTKSTKSYDGHQSLKIKKSKFCRNEIEYLVSTTIRDGMNNPKEVQAILGLERPTTTSHVGIGMFQHYCDIYGHAAHT